MSQQTDDFREAVEAGLQAELACLEPDAERVATMIARARAAGDTPGWSPSFVVEKLANAPGDRTVPEKWNWVLASVSGFTDREEYRLDE